MLNEANKLGRSTFFLISSTLGEKCFTITNHRRSHPCLTHNDRLRFIRNNFWKAGERTSNRAGRPGTRIFSPAGCCVRRQLYAAFLLPSQSHCRRSNVVQGFQLLWKMKCANPDHKVARASFNSHKCSLTIVLCWVCCFFFTDLI